MLAELPFATAEDIAAEYKPGVDVSVKGALRTLRAKRVVSDGIGVRPRGVGGRVSGARHVYSSLNLDAVRLYRRGDETGARRLARRAASLERRKEARRTAEELARELARGESLYPALDRLLRTDARRFVVALTAHTEAQRRDVEETLGLGAAMFARIASLAEGELVELRLEGSGAALPIRHVDLSPHTTLCLGAGVSLRWEPLGHGLTLLKSDAALDLGDEPAVRPYERALPAEDARVELTGALSVQATVRRPPPVPIAGSR
ncbi:MAG TPA: hypothetical protein VGW75_02925 [Solirubrobacteraceae bacterium]|jgi:hypothetical protein|nr:hypothetical protein [Solirubrobacteraceae bacterium]